MRALCISFVTLAFLAYPQVSDLQALDWSPDGTKLLLVVEGQLHLASLDSLSDIQPLYPGLSADWARFGPGDWFVFASPRAEEFALCRGFLSGQDPEILYQSPHPLHWPTVSPDGTKLAFVEDWNNLMVADLVTGEVRKVLGGPWLKATPEFLPWGKALVFSGLWIFSADQSWEIFYLDLESGNLLQLTSDPYFDWCPRVSPDGLWVAFVSNRGGLPDIWVLPLQGGSPFPLTEDPWEDAFPAWSPDGLVVGYASFRPEGWQFFRVSTY